MPQEQVQIPLMLRPRYPEIRAPTPTASGRTQNNRSNVGYTMTSCSLMLLFLCNSFFDNSIGFFVDTRNRTETLNKSSITYAARCPSSPENCGTTRKFGFDIRRPLDVDKNLPCDADDHRNRRQVKIISMWKGHATLSNITSATHFTAAVRRKILVVDVLPLLNNIELFNR